MRQDIVSAFYALLSDYDDWRANIDGLIFSKISEMEALRLELPLSVD